MIEEARFYAVTGLARKMTSAMGRRCNAISSIPLLRLDVTLTRNSVFRKINLHLNKKVSIFYVYILSKKYDLISPRNTIE